MNINTISEQTQTLSNLDNFASAVSATVPLTNAMGITYSAYDGLNLRLDAPIALNVNDKNTGFGGSIVSLATLAGWSLLSLLAHEKSDNNIIFIGESKIRYLAPVLGDFHALACITQEQKQNIIDAVSRNKTVKIELAIDVLNDDQCVATFTGKYFIKPDDRHIGLIKQQDLQ